MIPCERHPISVNTERAVARGEWTPKRKSVLGDEIASLRSVLRALSPLPILVVLLLGAIGVSLVAHTASHDTQLSQAYRICKKADCPRASLDRDPQSAVEIAAAAKPERFSEISQPDGPREVPEPEHRRAVKPTGKKI
jgi:hypothetical protein